MFQIFHLCVFNLSLILTNFSWDFFLEMCKKHFLFLDIHNRFDKSQYDKKISSCAFKGFIFWFKSMLNLRRVIFEHPSTSNRNKLLMRVIGAPFKFLLSSWSGQFRNNFLRALIAHFILIYCQVTILKASPFILKCRILLNWFKLVGLL